MTVLVDTIGKGAGGAPPPSRPKPWGAFASIIWVLVAFEVFGLGVDNLFSLTLLHTLELGSGLWHAAHLFAAWAVQLLVIIVAVWLVRWPVAEYLGWVKPRAKDVAFGIAVVLVWSLVQNGLAYLATGHAFDVAGYRASIAAGTSPWWYVLQWWPAIICAPIVEESAIRGFMWRGIEYRTGRIAALLVTSIFFTALHYRYFLDFDHEKFYVGTFGIYVIAGLMYGWLRWRSGNTTSTIIPHFFDNLYIQLSPIIASAFVA